MLLALTIIGFAPTAFATPFTMSVPGTSLVLPTAYPQAGGVAIVMVGANGNAYYQFSNPSGAFVGYNNSGSPAAFMGNPFTINNPISLNCGYSTCASYFGGSIAQIYIRFTANDGDTAVGNFDYNDVTLRLNGYDVANWSGITTQTTNVSGTTAIGATHLGFGDGLFDTGWFSSTNAAMLANILSTGKTTTQVYDRDPNDNYWDFSGGSNLADASLTTVAPGYSLTKTPSTTTFTAVGQSVTYTYVVTNVGSTRITALTVSDNKIASITCNKTIILAVSPGQTPDSATCTGTYQITQADFDAEKVVNIAQARGVPDYGSLGALTATATVTGPVTTPAISLTKSTTLGSFGAVGTTVPYSFLVKNTGNATLTSVVVTDPRIPALSCTVASLAPNATQTCTANYTVTQADMDGFAAGTNLQNTASVTSRDPKSVARTATSNTVSLPGPTPSVTMFVDKTTTATTYSTVGTVLPYQILVRNTGNVTWPVAPTVTDSKTSVSCPSGAVAPGVSITCTANYAVTQADLDAGTVLNTASGTVTVGSRTATGTDFVSVAATRTTTMTLDKRLAAASPTSFADAGIALTYAYDLKNTGNVTLNTLAVTDDKVTVTCAAVTLAPGATTTCTSVAYTTTQADLNAGGVTNIATASAKAAGTAATVTTTSDTVTVPGVQTPALTLVKTAPVLTAPEFVVGHVVTYSYAVTNAGNVDILAASQLKVTDDKIGTFNCGSGVLARGATRTCTATYTLTATDVAAGVVVNKATAKAGTTTSPQATATIAPTLSPGITLAKSASPASVSSTATLITYTFTVTNSGDKQLLLGANPITVSDPMVGSLTCSQPASFDPGQSYTCTATYHATQAQLDAGKIVNTAGASFPYANGGVTTTYTANSASNTLPVTENVSFAVAKTGPANFTSVGQVISFGFAVTNNGNTTLTRVDVTDPKITNLACTLTNIAPTTNKSCTGSYTVTQADMDAGQIVNTATGQGRTASGGTATVPSNTVTVPVSTGVGLKSANFAKAASPTTFTAVGNVITYTMSVSNTGAQTLRNVTVTDVLDAAYSCAIPSIAPGATDSSCKLTHTVTQAEFDAGKVDNTASAASADFTFAPGNKLTSSKTVIGPARTASFTLTKTASGPYTAVGNTVTFGFAVKNTGNVSLSNVLVSDPFFSPALSCTIPSVAPGATNTSCTGSYTVTQTDIDRGQITNTASASASAPAGVTAPANKTSTVVVAGPTRAPSVQITKTPSTSSYTAVGNTITYTFSVTNTGNVTLGSLAVTDTALGFSCNLANLAPGATTTTCTGGSPALQASKTITQADLDLGTYSNTAKVTGSSLIAGTAVSAQSAVTVNGPTQAPAITLAKNSSLVGTFDHVGQVVPYSYTITNSGNITLTGIFTVTDDKIASVSCASTPAAGIAPGGTLACTGSYTIMQADLNAGQVVNHATASTVQSVVPSVPGGPSIVTVTSPQATKTVSAAQLPALVLDKHVKSTSVSSYSAVGNVVTFEYVVRNTGNVTTTAPITIADDKIAGTLTCGAAGIAPGGSVTCQQNWTATQPALDAGQVTNSAVASTVFNAATVNSAADTATVTAVQTPKLAIAKTFVSTSAPGLFNVDDVLTYSIVVTNNGNVTVNGPITLTDSMSTPVCPALTGNVLAPGQTLTCSSTYVVSASDFDLGAVTNVASATGSFNGAPVVSPSDDATYPADADPSVSLTKTVFSGANPFAAVGDTITYRYTIDNTGNVSLVKAITITDDKLGGGPRACKPAGVFRTTDAPKFCDITYTVTQADVDAGFVTNNAVASTTYTKAGVTSNVVSPNATATVNATQNPKLRVVKTITAGANPAAVGNVLTYRIVTTNSGNQTISGVTVTDAKVGTLTCTVNGAAAPANVVLAPTKTEICTASYTVTQADIDAQVLTNTATARGSDPHGATVTATGSVTRPLVVAAPSVQVTKAVTPAPGPDDAFSSVGQPVKFVVTVTNTGNVTLNSSTVTDDLVGGSCAVPALAPGASDSHCTYTVIATQADIEALYGTAGNRYGGITNTATVVSQPANPGAAVVTDTGTAFAKGPNRVMKLSLLKSTVTTDFAALGDVITYDFVVANIGNATLHQPLKVTDPMFGAAFTCGTMPVAGLAPGDFLSCTKTHAVTQAEVDAGKVVNTATAASSEVPLPTDPIALAQATSQVTMNGTRSPSVSVDKTASISVNAKKGDVIAYTYLVTNTGNTTLRAVTPVDQHTSAAGTAALTVRGDSLATDVGELGTSTDAAVNGVWDVLKPGDVAKFTASYTVTQADVDSGAALTNTVTVASQGPAGTSNPTATDSASVAVIAAAPKLLALKTVNTSGLSSPPAVGNLLNYTVTVKNIGNVTMTAPALTDTYRDATGTAITPALVPTYSSGDLATATRLDVGETWTYLASHTVTQSDIDAGGVTNTVLATADDPFGTLASDVSDDDGTGTSDPTVTTLSRAPKVTVAKAAVLNDGGNGQADVGDTITYTYTVKNPGNVTLFDLALVETGFTGTGTTPVPLLQSGGAQLGGTAGVIDLATGGTATYQVIYTLTQADVDAGNVANQATISAKDPGGTTVSDLSGATAASNAVTNTPLNANAKLRVQKRANVSGVSSPAVVGDMVSYSIVVKNTGNVTLNTISLADTFKDANGVALTLTPVFASGDTNSNSKLELTETWTYTASVALTQAMIDAGGLSNSATVSAKTPANATVSDVSDNGGAGTSDPTITTIAPAPVLQVIKQLDVSGLSTPPVVGNLVAYAITVKNTGNVTLHGPVLVDTLTNAGNTTLTLTQAPTYVSGDTGADAKIAVGEVWTYRATYTLTQADIDSGSLSNTVLGTAKTPKNANVSDVSDDNGTGNSDPTVLTITQAPSLTNVKTSVFNIGSDGVATVGDTIDYRYTIRNSGNVSLTDISVTETGFTGSGTTPVPAYISGGANLGGNAGIIDLPVGGSAIFGVSYLVTQADIDAGFVDNSATAVGKTPTASTVQDVSGATAADDVVTHTPLPRVPGIEATKTADISGLGTPVVTYDPVVFTIQLRNMGNVSLSSPGLTENFTRRDGSALTLTPVLISGDAGTVGRLDVGETWVYRVTYNLTQADIDAGGLSNAVTGTATAPGGAAVSDVSDNGNDTDGNTTNDPTVVKVPAVPKVGITKALAAGSTAPYDHVGQVLSYQFTVTNLGNVTLTAPITVADPLIEDAGGVIACRAPPIARGASVVCTGSYVITQADLDAGTVKNTASVSVTQPVKPVNPGDPATVVATDTSDEVTATAAQTQKLTLAKAIAAGSASSFAAVGDTVTFDYTVTNAGNVTLAGPISVVDDKISGTLSCGPGPLLPGASVTCSQVWTATQADLNVVSGVITNTATAAAKFKTATVTSAADQATIKAVQNPKLTIVKTIRSAVPNAFDVNTVLTYDFVITNDGNVTIDGPITVDDSLTTVDCGAPVTELLPDATLNCEATYTLRAGDIKLGSTTNVAAALGSFAGKVVRSKSDSATYPVTRVPALSLTKNSVPSTATFTAVGDIVTYSYTLTNSGDAGFSEDIFITDDKIGGPLLCRDAAVEGIFSVGATYSCTADYYVTQPDLDAGFVTNEAIANTIFAPGTVNEIDVSSAPATKTAPADKQPALSVVKTVTAGPSPAAVGDELTYQISVTNSGNQTMSGVKAVDPRLGALDCTVDSVAIGANVVLAPAKEMICTGSYTVTQADVDAQSLINTATATGTSPQGVKKTASGQHDQPLVAADPAISLVKSLLPDPFTAPAFTVAGQELTFAMTVTNTGNVTLNDAVVTDALSAGSCTIPTLAPGAVNTSCRFTYTTTQADVDAVIGAPAHGGFVNSAAVTARPANPSAAPVDASDDLDVLGPVHAPSFSLDKTADVTAAHAFGDVINYRYLITNSGNITLHDQPILTDDKIASLSCPVIAPAGMAPGGTMLCTASYTVTQADVDAGFVTNNADVSSNEVTAAATDSVTVPIAADPKLTVVKTASITANAKVGDVIDYSYVVTNTGNVSLSAVTLDDQHSSAAGTSALPIAGDVLTTDLAEQGNSTDSGADGIWDDLGPGDVVSFTASYTVTQADIDAADPIANTVTVTANTPTGPLANPPTDSVSISLQAAAPSLEVVKLVDLTGLSAPPIAGETLPYTITIANTGNQTLRNIRLLDSLRRVDGTVLTLTAGPSLVSGDAGVAGAMEVGEVWTYSASYTLTQADIDGGGVTNQVTVRVATPAGGTLSDLSDDDVAPGGSDPTKVLIPANPKIVGEKTITAGPTTVGSTVTFLVTATNAGNTSLSAVNVASDTLRRADGTALTLTSGPSFDGASLGSSAGHLLPGEVANYVASYVLTQADIDAGGIRNLAVVTGKPPVGGPLTDVTDNGDDSDGNLTNDPVVLTIPAEPSLALVKRLATGSGPTYDKAGQVLGFAFEVRNTGNITLTAPLRIADAMISAAGGSVTCPVGPLAPAAMVTCTGSYTITQADVDAGSLTNLATASSGSVASPEASRTVSAQQKPSLSLVKTAAPMTAAEFTVGAVAQYKYVVKNTGNVTVTNPISISDNRIAANAITCPALPAGGLAPAASMTCTANYTVTEDDIDLGSVTNLATGTDGKTVSPIASETIPDAGEPALTLVKTATSGANFAAVGDVIAYKYKVTNTGTRAFVRPVVVTDDKLGEIACFTKSASDPDFHAGEVVTCTANHTVTQEDLDAGRVVNQAFAHTSFGSSQTLVVSEPDVVTVLAKNDPQITLGKSATPNAVTAVGQVVTYHLSAVNSGNQSLRSIEVIDPMLPGLVCQATVLLPGQSVQCDADYTVTQADIDRGTLVNTAKVSGLTPKGSSVTDTATATTRMPRQVAGVTMVKTAVPTPFGAVGSTLTYAFEVTNSGNVTLHDLTVTDPMDASYSCTIAVLAPGAVDSGCRMQTEVTQGQVDKGSISNTATVTGLGPKGAAVEGADSITTQGPERQPGIEATKVIASSGNAPGAVIAYELLLRNTGNVTLRPEAPVDVMQRVDSSATALDTAFALTSGDNGNGRLDVGETWHYLGSHVLTQADIDAGGLSNQVSVTAGAVGGGSVSDLSDNGDDADGNSADDPTVFKPIAGPGLEVTKLVTQGGSAVGDRVRFTITAVNTGTVTLNSITIADSMARADGTSLTGTLAGGRATLAPNAAAVWTLDYVLTQADIDAGGIANSALVSGKDPQGHGISDVSDNGDDADGNTKDDATEVNIAPAAGLVVVKHLDSIGKAAGEEAVFTITASNTGNLVLSNVSITDDLSRIDGTALTSPVPHFQKNSKGSVRGKLVPAEVATWVVHYVLTQDDVDAGGVSNQALVAAKMPSGGAISDQSDDDGNGDSDPTIGLVGAAPGMAVVKSVNTPKILFPTVEQATFTMTVKNTGNITETHVGLSDDLTAFLAPATLDPEYPIKIVASGFGAGTANPAYNGTTVAQTLTGKATLLPGQTGQVQITVTYSTVNGSPAGENIALGTSRENPTPSASNPVKVPETDSDGDGVTDDDEGKGDRDHDGIPNDKDYDPTGAFYCEDTGQLMSGGKITVSGPSGSQSGVGTSNRITIVRDGSDGRFQFYVTQAGTYTMAISYPPGTQPSTTRLPGGALDLTSLLPANPASLGAGEVGTTGKLGDFSAAGNPFYLTFVIEAGDPHIFNNNIPLLGCHGGENVVASKSADRSTAVFGETVNYTLTFENTSAVTYAAAHVVDLLPEGLVYTPGSATVNGVAQEPTVTGHQLDFASMTVAPADKITIHLAARVQAQSVGELTNQTWLQDSGGVPISNRATATVRIQPEAVFECSDVIGKVFDDVNHNGYPDGREGPPPLTNEDSFTGGKYGKPKPAPKDYEPGLAGVRLATVNGFLITTDEFGRFHVPCAALPKSDGSNFILKVDPHSLPLGYQMTTENPRVLRLTPGKVAKMNFGAAMANVLDINLTSKAFAAGEDQPSAGFAQAVKEMIRDIKAKPTALHLSYLLAKGEDVNLANARLKAAEAAIRKAWRGVGSYDLEIARELRRVK